MKVYSHRPLQTIPIAIALFLNLMISQGVSQEGKVQHSLRYASAQFVVSKTDRSKILRDSQQWLEKNGFELIESAEKIPPGSQSDSGSVNFFQKSFREQGRMVVALNQNGSADLIVESFQSLPESARFRAKAIDEYRIFALWMNAHPAQMVGDDTEDINQSINSTIKKLLSKATKATHGNPLPCSSFPASWLRCRLKSSLRLFASISRHVAFDVRSPKKMPAIALGTSENSLLGFRLIAGSESLDEGSNIRDCIQVGERLPN